MNYNHNSNMYFLHVGRNTFTVITCIYLYQRTITPVHQHIIQPWKMIAATCHVQCFQFANGVDDLPTKPHRPSPFQVKHINQTLTQ